MIEMDYFINLYINVYFLKRDLLSVRNVPARMEYNTSGERSDDA